MNVDPEYHAKLLELRSLKDFAAICQFIHMFHPAFALDDFDTEQLEQALVDPQQMPYLVDLQARMLRALTQERRISFDNWFKYAQKEFEKRAQDQNPWLEEDAVNYEYFSLETKLFILTCLCEWQLDDPEQFRSNFNEEDEVAIEWRVDPIGHDANDRIYWLFDDNRLYRENPPVKANNKKAKQAAAKVAQQKPVSDNRRGTRRSTRGQKVEESEPEPEPEFETPPITPGVEWEPVCITQQEWEDFANLFRRSKHPDEKALHNLINDDILPKILGEFKEKDKKRETLEAIANRKRSSRIVIREFEVQEKARLEALRQQDQQAAAELRKQELRERRAEREKQLQQHIRDNRLKEREERLKARENAIWEREAKKKQQQQRIAKEREERKKKRVGGGHKGENSEDEAGRHQDEEEEDWVFDCVCGVFGNNLDDGELMIACGKCNVWQHVACLKQEDAQQGKAETDWESVDFTCPRCIIKEKRKAMRKEKKEQKLREEALAGNVGVNVSSEPKVPKEPKKAPKEKVPKEKVPKEKVPKDKVKSPKSRSGSLTNGHHPQSAAYVGPSTYSTQPYPPLGQPLAYQPEASYHHDHHVQPPQPYYNGHPISNGNPGPVAGYAYQPAAPQQPHNQYSPPPPSHHNHQQQPYQHPYQQQQSHAGHYGSHTPTPSYQAYLPSPQGSSMHTPAPLNHHLTPAAPRPHQLDSYSVSQPPVQPHPNHYSPPYAQQQHRADGAAYGPGQAPVAFGQTPVAPIHKRPNPADEEMEGVERPPKMINHQHQHP